MARDIFSEKIGEYTYEFTQLDMRLASRVGRRLLSSAVGMSALADIGKMAGRAFNVLPEHDFEYIIDTFAGLCKVRLANGNTPYLTDWPEHFAGRPGELLEWAIAAVMGNFPGLTASIERLKSKYSHLIETDEPETDEADAPNPGNP